MVGNANAWWATEPIHGGEPTYMVAWPAKVDIQRPFPQPGPPPKLAGWLARPPCMWAPHHVWVRFPTVHLGFPPCILIKGISYQVSGIFYASDLNFVEDSTFTHCEGMSLFRCFHFFTQFLDDA